MKMKTVMFVEIELVEEICMLKSDKVKFEELLWIDGLS